MDIHLLWHPSTFIKKSVYEKDLGQCGIYKLNYEIAGDFEIFKNFFKVQYFFEKKKEIKPLRRKICDNVNGR